MPTYRITDTASGDQRVVNQPTDWDAWMHYRFTHHRIAHAPRHASMAVLAMA